MTKHTNAANLSKLSGLSRERVTKLLARGDIPEAVRVFTATQERGAWRIPIPAATRWLRGCGVRVKRWEPHPHYHDLWVGVTGGADVAKGK